MTHSIPRSRRRLWVAGTALTTIAAIAAAAISLHSGLASAKPPQAVQATPVSVASTDIGDLFKRSARSWGIGALMSLPVFDGGRRAAGVQNANAQWDVAAAAYREQVLGAFRDVEDQLSSLRLLSDQANAQKVAVDAATRATALSGAADIRGRLNVAKASVEPEQAAASACRVCGRSALRIDFSCNRSVT